MPIPYPSTLYGTDWQWTASITPSGQQTPTSTGETRLIRFFNENGSEFVSQQVNGVVVRSARWRSSPVSNEGERTLIFSLSDGTFLKVHQLPYANSLRRIECTDYLAALPTSADPYIHQYQARDQ
ncbi:hypothetical protein [Fibrivirga algicola]|uniref:Lipocalin-like domain-containing protein n=1 Tax=Fibrivirga algicola TaxID=2950420 RepID=A0ABX0Q9K0_9BACT|nr:hypothetical protein [Fibrivirga algicola]NID08825.1 hypothetical protein [Fibrivirga algicola]